MRKREIKKKEDKDGKTWHQTKIKRNEKPQLGLKKKKKRLKTNKCLAARSEEKNV